MKFPAELCAYVAAQDRTQELKEEITRVVYEKENFLLAEGPLQSSFWAQNIWENVKIHSFDSIKDGASHLRALQRKWWHYPLNCIRRTKLIQEALPVVKIKPLSFPTVLPEAPLGSFTLLSENEMLYASRCLEKIPNGEFLFADPPYSTPSEAYRKLWEALLRIGRWPSPGEACVDLGSSPGSWTQALLALGAKVLSVDKASLEIEAHSQLQFLKKDAFKLDPSDTQDASWIFSDIICYPEKLLELALKWKAARPQATFVFSIKFQGKWDPKVAESFCEIPGSMVRHLYNNKHELCWISLPT